MRCEGCQKEIPTNAVFCIYCARPVGTAQHVQQTMSQPPATGATIRLDPGSQPAPSAPTQPSRQRAGRKAHPRTRSRRQPRHHTDPSGPLFLIGLIWLVWSGMFWPGILLLLGLVNIVKHAARGDAARGVKRLLFLGGILMIVLGKAIFPGIVLILVASQIPRRRRAFGWHP